MAPLFGAAGQKVGKIVQQRSVGASILAGISHILGPKSQQETIENKGFTEMRVEKNTNLLEVNLVGVSGVIIIGTIAIMFLCLCGKIKKSDGKVQGEEDQEKGGEDRDGKDER